MILKVLPPGGIAFAVVFLAIGSMSGVPLTCSYVNTTEPTNIQEVATGTVNRVLPLPEKFIRPRDPDLKPTTDVNTSLEWIVYSDRADNITYTDPEGTTEKARIGFLDQFYVVEEVGDFVRIVRDPEVTRFQLSAKAQDYGWIRKDHLLLWHHCLTTPIGGIDRKAITINTIRRAEKIGDGSPVHSVDLLSEPDSASAPTGVRSQLFEFFYVFKRAGNYALLGKVAYVIKDELEIRKNIVGWAPVDRLVFWNNRIAVEPNWEEKAAEERRSGRRARFFEDAALAELYKKGENTIPSLWSADSLNRRPIGTWRRFPLIKYSAYDSTIFFARVMGEVPGDGSSTASVPRLQQHLDRAIQKSRHINVLFIVDATDSMEKYFDAVAAAIHRSMEKLNRPENRNQFQFGVAIYRDYAEGKNTFQLKRLGPPAEASQFLREVDPSDHKDQDQSEALYLGMRDAVLGVGLDEGQHNVCVVIGDAGNHRNRAGDVKAEEVIEILFEKQCHLLAVQVHHRNDPAYDDFPKQMKHLALATAQKTYEARDQTAYEMFGVEAEPPQLNPDGTIDGGAYASWTIPTEPSPSLSGEEVEQLIVDFIEYANRFNNDVVNALTQLIDGKGYHEVVPGIYRSSDDSRFRIVDRFEPTILDVLTRRAHLTPEDYAVLRSSQYQLSVDASAPFYVEGQAHPLFKRVLLISVEQLSELISVLRRLTFASGENDRDEMVHTWKQILRAYMGSSDEAFEMLNTNGALEEMSFREINEMVWGLPRTRPLLQNVKLGDIRHPHLFPPEAFAEYRKLLEATLGHLREIRNDPEYPYSFRTNEYQFYWIDEDIIP